MRPLVEIVAQARAVGTPLLGISTPDQYGTQKAFSKAFTVNPSGGQIPQLSWDGIRGLRGINKPGKEAFKALDVEPAMTTNPQTLFEVAEKLPEWTILFLMNAHRFVQDPFVASGILNLRDEFKANNRTLILLAPGYDMPPELRQDVILLDEPLPSDDVLKGIVADVHRDGKLKAPTEDVLERAVDALRGLSAFTAEQLTAMSLVRGEDRQWSLDLEELWRRKQTTISQIRGLTLTINGPRYETHVRGSAAIVQYMRKLFGGPRRPRGVVWIDELEKAFAGLGANGQAGDSSGVTQRALEKTLKWMDGGGDRPRNKGIILVGPGGSGKSLIAQTTAGEFSVPLIEFDLGGMFGSLVGETEQAVRDAFKAIDGICGGNAFVIATCNKLDALPPELRRRFTSGVWFFDLPNPEERDLIWKLQSKAFGVKDKERPDDADWTGAEIRNCCETARDLGLSLNDASEYVIPVAKADRRGLEVLRANAHERFKSASKTGLFTTDEDTVKRGRRMSLEDRPSMVAVAVYDKEATPDTAAEAVPGKTTKGES